MRIWIDDISLGVNMEVAVITVKLDTKGRNLTVEDRKDIQTAFMEAISTAFVTAERLNSWKVDSILIIGKNGTLD
jgi:hypothetical protein